MDFQIGVCGPGGIMGARNGSSRHTADRGVLARAAEALSRGRSEGDMIVHIRVGFDEAGMRRVNHTKAFRDLEANEILAAGSRDAAFCPEVMPIVSELVVTKSCVSPFAGTGLDEILRAQGINRLLLGGVATNFVVESAARHAGDRGYHVQVVEDICASRNEEMHRFAIEQTLPMFAAIVSLDEAYPAP
ncbi:cysteine hydrolase family protein [Rhodococcus opacus]